MGIEPTSSAWKAEVLPLNYTRSCCLPIAKYLLFRSRRSKAVTLSERSASTLHTVVLYALQSGYKRCAVYYAPSKRVQEAAPRPSKDLSNLLLKSVLLHRCTRCIIPPENWWRGQDSNLRRLSQQIYSLPPLTAWVPLRDASRALSVLRLGVSTLWRTDLEVFGRNY